jgi:hypothetical protein
MERVLLILMQTKYTVYGRWLKQLKGKQQGNEDNQETNNN